MKTIAPEQIKDNIFDLAGKDWFLVTAGTAQGFNTMTAAWGGAGVLWNKNVCFIYIRPTRHTFGFLEKSGTFTLSFLPEKHRGMLNYCGSHSGRDVDKIKETGLTPVFTGGGSVYFKEARLVIECRKLYFQDLDPAHFLDPAIEKNYSQKDYHRMYIGEILQCMIKE